MASLPSAAGATQQDAVTNENHIAVGATLSFTFSESSTQSTETKFIAPEPTNKHKVQSTAPSAVATSPVIVTSVEWRVDEESSKRSNKEPKVCDERKIAAASSYDHPDQPYTERLGICLPFDGDGSNEEQQTWMTRI